MSETDVIAGSLAVAGERLGDITAPVYERYFANCPGSKELMAHIDQYVQGRMLAEVIELLLAPDPTTMRDYLKFETRTHASYGVETAMYRNLLSSVRDVVREALGEQWDTLHERGWQSRIDALLAEILAAVEVAGIVPA
jgi:hemoglobin-like flavoprotein